MGFEIERRFLVLRDKLPPIDPHHGVRIIQGYLSTSPTIRVRLAAKSDVRRDATLTVKGTGTRKRVEVEAVVSWEDGEQLLEMTTWRVVKRRHYLHYASHEWSVDFFHGAHQGGLLAEIELQREDQDFERPPWVGREVTEDPRFTNLSLAVGGRFPEF